MKKNIKDYDRFFTFGCSFTNYVWPTWADILGLESKDYQNWGRSGGGNFFNFQRLIECHQKNKLTKNDLVIVMWTNVAREDRIINGSWHLFGNLYSQDWYNEEWMKKTIGNDIYGLLYRDLCLVAATKHLLDGIGCEYYFLSMVPLCTNINQYNYSDFSFKEERFIELKKIFHDTLVIIKPSIYETVYNSSWDFDKETTVWFDKEKTKPDPHPKPGDAAKYLNTVFPQYKLSTQQLEFVAYWDKRLLAHLPDDLLKRRDYFLLYHRPHVDAIGDPRTKDTGFRKI